MKFYDRARSEWHMRTLGESTSKLLEDSISYYEYWEKDDAIFQDIIMKIAYANECSEMVKIKENLFVRRSHSQIRIVDSDE